MATVTNKAGNDEITNRSGRVRVLESDTDFEEMNAGHIIPGASPPKNEHQRGGFGDRDGRPGFGTDSADGDTALSTNDNSAYNEFPTDGLQSSNKLDPGTITFTLDDDDDDTDDDFTDVDTDDDFDDDDVDISEIPDDDFDTDLDDDFDDTDIDDDLNLDDDEDLDEDERY